MDLRCLDFDFLFQAGISFLEQSVFLVTGTTSMTIKIMVDGVTRDATADELKEIEARSAIDIEILRAGKNEEIDRDRAKANASTFPYAGKLIACDALSRSDIDGVANHIALFDSFPEGFPGGWKAVDKTMLPLPDIDAFRSMYASMTARGTQNFNHSQELKAKLALASTPEEIAAVAW